MFVVIHFWENTFVVQTFCSRVSSRVRLEVLRSEWGAMVRGTHDVYVKCSQNNQSSRLSLVWEFFWGHSSGSSECRSFCGMKSIWGQTIYTPHPPPTPPPSPQRVNWEHWPRNTMQRAFKFVCKTLKWRLNVACLTPSPETTRFLISFLWMSHSQQSPSQVFIQWHLLPLLLQRVLCLYVLSCVCSVEQEIHVYFVQ